MPAVVLVDDGQDNYLAVAGLFVRALLALPRR